MSRLTPKGSNVEAQIPLGRMGKKGTSACSSVSSDSQGNAWLMPSEDIAQAATFLFSPAGSWITGSVMVCLTYLPSLRALPLSSQPRRELWLMFQVVDGGESHIRAPMLPYPSSVLDPDSVKNLVKARM